MHDSDFAMDLVEFKRKRKRAYTMTETAKLLNYHRKTIPRLVKYGYLPPPVGELPGGATAFHHLSYYSEDHIWEARNLMAQTHMGRARKDGRVTNNKTPTEQELRYAMGDSMMYYVKDENGRFVPTFAETL
jgi:predicted DNA-binding transcriptional regulator AlpA